MLLRIAFACLLALSASAAQGAGRIFFDGFETYPLNQSIPTTNWSHEGLPGRTVNTPTDGLYGVHGGSQMARFNMVSGTTFETAVRDMGPLYTNELFLRIWFRFDNNYDASDGLSAAHVLRGWHWSGDFGTYVDFLEANPYGNTWTSDAIVCGSRLTGSPSYLSGGFSNLKVGWHQLERYYNTATGVYRIWYDNVLLSNFSGSGWGSCGHNFAFYIQSNFGSSATDGTAHMYADDVEIFSDLGTGSFTGSMLNGDIQVSSGGGVAPTITSVSCSPTLNQAPAATTCSATASGDTPITWAWTGSGANCTFATPSAASTTLTCSYGGARTPCVTATNSTGSDGPDCVAANSVVWRYVKPTGFGAN